MKIDTSTAPFSDFAPSFVPIMEQPVPMVTMPVIAQQFDESSFIDRSTSILDNFVESGQVWALLVGVVLGYAIRGITTY